MTTYYFSKALLVYASFSTTEDGRECLEWDLPEGKDYRDEMNSFRPLAVEAVD